MVILQRLLKHFELETVPFSGLFEVDNTAVVRAKARDTGMIPVKVPSLTAKIRCRNLRICYPAKMQIC